MFKGPSQEAWTSKTVPPMYAFGPNLIPFGFWVTFGLRPFGPSSSPPRLPRGPPPPPPLGQSFICNRKNDFARPPRRNKLPPKVPIGLPKCPPQSPTGCARVPPSTPKSHLGALGTGYGAPQVGKKLKSITHPRLQQHKFYYCTNRISATGGTRVMSANGL